MADIRIRRHGDRWAVSEGDGTPFFESYTREEAESEARRRAGTDGRVTVEGEDSGGEGQGQQAVAAEAGPEPEEARERGDAPRPGGSVRSEQGGL